MPAYLSPFGNEPQFDANGDPLSGGQLFTYAAGSVTPATTYTDSTGATPQTNPVILNSRGVPASPIWLTGGVAYKFVLQDANGVTLPPTLDNVQGINDPSAITSPDQWVLFAGAPTFLSTTSFSVVGDQTPTLHIGRRLKTTNSGGLVYGVITASAFATGVTTVTVSTSAGVLDAGLSSIAYGLLSYVNGSVPLQTGQLLNVQVIAATAVYTATPLTRSVVVELVGAGGGGAGTAATAAGQLAAGGGGGAGGYAKCRITSGFSGVTVTIGSGGAGASGGNGGNGGTSSFGAVFSATGGTGGSLGSVVAAGTIAFVVGGAGGAGASGNVLNASGQPGAASLYATSSAVSGAGGVSMFGAGGGVVTAAAGVAAASFGAGGGGAASGASTAARAGGAGGNGICIVWEYA